MGLSDFNKPGEDSSDEVEGEKEEIWEREG